MMIEPIFKEEEKAILLSVDKAKASSGNSQTIGRNGEIPILSFLNNYLPNTLKAVSGHFLTPTLTKSPQIDVMIIDSRYPLLAYNEDNTILAMAHSVLGIIEIKTNLTKNDIKKTSRNLMIANDLLRSVWIGKDFEWKMPFFGLLAYRISLSRKAAENAYYEHCDPEEGHFDISILRSDKNSDNGIRLHFEPTHHYKKTEKLLIQDYYTKGDFLFLSFDERTPLADFYYQLIQNCYYTIDHRGFSIGDIGSHFNKYLDWTT